MRFCKIRPSFFAIPKISRLRRPQLSAIAYPTSTLPKDARNAMLNVMNVARWQSHGIDKASAYDIHSHVLRRKKSAQTVSNKANNAHLGGADTLRHSQTQKCQGVTNQTQRR